MNIKNQRTLVKLVSSGRNTYRQILAIMPELTEADLEYVSRSHGVENDQLLLLETPRPIPKDEPFSFLPDDRFRLSEAGENILYQLHKERYQETLSVVAAASSIIAAICSLLSIIRY